jgi:predicted ABC-type ATPase
MVVGMAEDEDMAEDAFDPGEPRAQNGEWSETDAPKKTVAGYKLFKTKPSKPGQIFPTQIGTARPIPIGKWLAASNDTTKGFAPRPGWHSSRLPEAPQQRSLRTGKIQSQNVWGEVEIPDDVDWQSKADATPTKDLPGSIPVGGHYVFTPKPKAEPDRQWRISGAIKINRLMADEEVRDALTKAGRTPDEAEREVRGSIAQDAYSAGEPRDSSGEWTSGGGRSKGVPNYEELMAKVRALEGTRAALKDPQTGKIYTGSTHGAAYRSAPPDAQERMKPYIYDGNFAKARIAGFLDDNDKWMRRDEAEAKYGVYNGGSAEGQRRERSELQSTIAQFHAQDAFDPSEPRDEGGEWTSGGGSMKATAAHPQAQHVQQQQASALLASKVKAMPKTQDERVSMAMQLAKEEGVDDAIAKVSAKVQQLTPTDAPLSKGGFKNDDGTWASSRQALHQNILRDLFTDDAVRNATPAPGADPTLTVLGGRGGSGKSWLTSGQGPVDRSKSIVIDADDFKRLLGSKGWDASAYHEESSYLAETAMKFAMDHHLNVVLDATMKTGSTAAKRLMQFSNAGYDLDGYYMFAPPETAVRRAYRRFKSGGETGRYVPGDVILSNTDNEKNFDSVLPMFKNWAVSEDGPPRLFSKSLEKADGKAA